VTPARGSLLKQLQSSVAIVVVAALVAVLFGLVSPGRAVWICAIVTVAIAAYTAVAESLAAFEPPQRSTRRLPMRRRRPVPAFFDRVERRLELASVTAAQYEPLRQRLRAIAEQRLAGHGVRLESDEARRLLGEEAWRLLEDVPHEDRFSPGPRPPELHRLLEALERV
jgi:hypothetical protein